MTTPAYPGGWPWALAGLVPGVVWVLLAVALVVLMVSAPWPDF
jgi:hypothetical protein